MAQFSKGDTFVDGQQVTGARLNQLVDSATLLVGAISEQTSITANTVASADQVLLNDSGVLKKATVGDLLNSNLPITTSAVGGVAGVDIVLTPPAGRKFDVAGALESDSSNVTGNSTVGGTLTVTGTTTTNGALAANGTFTSSGTANFTGALQVNGTVGYVLTEVIEETIAKATGAASNTLHSLFTSASYTKPTGEIWEVEVDAVLFNGNNSSNWHYRITDSADSVKYVRGYFSRASTLGLEMVTHRFLLDLSTTHTGTFVFRVKCTQNNAIITPSSTDLTTAYPDNTEGTTGKFRIYKYKTA